MDSVNRSPSRQFDASEIDWLISEYLAESEKRVTPTTFKDYRYLLGFFRRWWSEVGAAQAWTIKRTDFYDFIEWMKVQPSRQGDKLALRTIEAALKRLRQFFKWSYVEEFYQRDYGAWIPALTDEPTERQSPTVECLEQLFQAAGQSDKPVRNKAILAILCGTAIRRAECTQIDIEHVKFYGSGGGEINIPRGKGRKPRIVIFDDITGHYIALHLTVLAESNIATGALFRGRGGRLTPKGLYDVVKVAAQRAGLEDIVQGPHDLRRMFATYWSRKQRGEGFTQPLSIQLGHADKKMTLHYAKQTLDDVREVFVSPMERLRRS